MYTQTRKYYYIRYTQIILPWLLGRLGQRDVKMGQGQTGTKNIDDK